MKISKRNYKTIATIVGSKALEMHKKGSNWVQGNKYVDCVDMGKLANNLLKLSSAPKDKFVFPWDKKPIKKLK